MLRLLREAPPSGEVPVVDEAALRRLIREDELREAAARRSTTSEGTNSVRV